MPFSAYASSANSLHHPPGAGVLEPLLPVPGARGSNLPFGDIKKEASKDASFFYGGEVKFYINTLLYSGNSEE